MRIDMPLNLTISLCLSGQLYNRSIHLNVQFLFDWPHIAWKFEDLLSRCLKMHVAIVALLAAAASVSALSNPHRRAAEVLRRRPAVTVNTEVDLQRRDESPKPQFLTSKTERGFSIPFKLVWAMHLHMY